MWRGCSTRRPTIHCSPPWRGCCEAWPAKLRGIERADPASPKGLVAVRLSPDRRVKVPAASLCGGEDRANAMGKLQLVEDLSPGLRPVFEVIRGLLAGATRDEARSR